MARERLHIMKAHPLDSKKLSALGINFCVQPKLNGVRAYSDAPGRLLSSTSREFPYLERIKSELRQLPYLPFDGELYIHGKPWNYINSIASRTINIHPDEDELHYHIFDVKLPTSFITRCKLLKDTLGFIEKERLTTIKIVQTHLSSPDLWNLQLEEYMKHSYEGIMFRSTTGFYQEKRSNYLLKFKPTCTDIYKIVGAIQGEGWCYDRLGAFLVQDKHGHQFEIGSGSYLTAAGRMEAWELYISGKLSQCHLLVKHEKLKTANGFPQCAVAAELIHPEDLHKYSTHEDLQK